MKKLFNLILIFIFMLTIDVKAGDTCHFYVGSECMDYENDFVYDDSTGSITYNKNNNTITFDNYEGSHVTVNGLSDETITVIFSGNNTFNKNDGQALDFYENGDVIFKGKDNNATVNFVNMYGGFYTNYHQCIIENLKINSISSSYPIYINSGTLEVRNVKMVQEGGSYTVDGSNSKLIFDHFDLTANNLGSYMFYTYYYGITMTNCNIKGDNDYYIFNVSYVDEHDEEIYFENVDFDVTNIVSSPFYFADVTKFTMINCNVHSTGKNGNYNDAFRIYGGSNEVVSTIRIEGCDFDISEYNGGIILSMYNGNIPADLIINNSNIKMTNINGNPIELSNTNIYSNNNDIYVEFDNDEIELYGNQLTTSVIGGSLQVISGYSAIKIETKYNTFENVDIKLESTGNGYDGLYFSNSYDGITTLKNCNIETKGLHYGIYASSGELYIENCDINAIDCNQGIVIFTSKFNFDNSTLNLTNPNKEYVYAGIFTSGYSYSGGICNINNSYINIDILTNNTRTNNENGIYSYQSELTFKDSYVSIKNLYDGENTSISPNYTYKYGINGSDTKIKFDNTSVYIITDNKSGNAYYNSGTVDGNKLTITGTGYKLLTPNTNWYEYDSNQVLLNNDLLDNIDEIKYDLDIYGNKELLIDKDTYTYKIINMNEEINKNDANNFIVKIDGNFMLLNEVFINDVKFNKNEDYKVTEGSTVITFTQSGLNKLNDLNTGMYTMKATYTNGEEVLGDFKVVPKIVNPKTGDNLFIYILLSFISFLSMITISKRTRKI